MSKLDRGDHAAVDHAVDVPPSTTDGDSTMEVWLPVKKKGMG